MATAAGIDRDARAEELKRDNIVIRTYDLWKTYVMGDQEINAVSGVDLEIRRGEYLAIMGPSGSGKSTLMNLIGCLDSPTKGEYYINGNLVSEMDDDELARIRNKEIGFVFQTFNLLPRATALHNVELPLIYAGVPAQERIERAKQALRIVDLEARMYHKPNDCLLYTSQRGDLEPEKPGGKVVQANATPDPVKEKAKKEELQGVFIVKTGGAEFREVKTGITGTTDIEVVSGDVYKRQSAGSSAWTSCRPTAVAE